MISLERSRFWILGLLPLRRETILWSKFLFSAGGTTISYAGLILLSDLLFGVGPLLVSVHYGGADGGKQMPSYFPYASTNASRVAVACSAAASDCFLASSMAAANLALACSKAAFSTAA